MMGFTLASTFNPISERKCIENTLKKHQKGYN